MLLYTPTRRFTRAAGLALMLIFAQQGMADDTLTRLTQSLEGTASSWTDERSDQLDLAPVDASSPLAVGGSRMSGAAQARVLAHPTGRVFTVYDAHAFISRDYDDDGFYHHLKVSFDPDVTSGGSAWVYAKLYLSLEGGPWNRYFTTDVFPIDGDARDDAYNVVTNLLDGYTTGYYDVLIELYDADYDLLVDSYGPYEDRDLAVLPLEDSFSDDNGGGGAMGPGLLLLTLIAVTKGYITRSRGGGLQA
jgi:hypothetical protein